MITSNYCSRTPQMGEIVNYMQLDTSRLEQVAHNIHTVWDGALQVLVAITTICLLCARVIDEITRASSLVLCFEFHAAVLVALLLHN